MLHQWLPAPPTAGRQPGLPGVRGCRHPSAPRHPPPHPLPGPSSAAGTGGRGQITTHPNLPKGLLHGAGSSAFPLPGQGSSTGWGQSQWDTHYPLPPDCPSPCWETPPHATPGGALEGAAQPRRAVGAPSLPSSERCPRLGSGLARAGDWHPRRYRAQPVLSFSSSIVFLFLSFFLFSFGTTRARSRLLPPPRCAPPIPVPGPGGRGGSRGRHAAVTRRSLLLWPGPSAPCPCPAVRLSCRPCPGRPHRARGRGLRRPRSGRSS